MTFAAVSAVSGEVLLFQGIIRIYKVPDESFEDDEDAQDSDGDGFGEGSLFE